MNEAAVEISPYWVAYTQAERSAVGYCWPDGTFWQIKSTAGDTLGISPDAEVASVSRTSTVAHGTFANPTGNSVTTVRINGVPNWIQGVPTTWEYASLGPTVRMPDLSLISMVHLEHHVIISPMTNPATCYLGLAKSTDEGMTWNFLDYVLAPGVGFEATAVPYWQEAFDGPIIRLGDYYWVWHPEYYDHTSVHWYWAYASGQRYSVARCPVAEFQAAVAANRVPTFKKFDGESWTIDGRTGTAAPVKDLRSDWHVPFWMRSLGCYVAPGQDKTDGIDRTYVRMQFSRDGVNWTTPAITVSEVEETGYVLFGKGGHGNWYVAILPPEADLYNAAVLGGNTFDILYTIGPRWSNCEMRRRTITFHAGGRRTRGAWFKGGPNLAYMR